MKEIHPKANNAGIFLTFAYMKALPTSSVQFTTVEKS